MAPITVSALSPVAKRTIRESRFTGQRVHFIGIGGCGMSGLARILLDSGAIVTGSDPKSSMVTRELTRLGVKISRDQLGQFITDETDLVVRTAAVKDDNTEFAFARAKQLKHLKYAQLLGEIMQERLGVAIAGTHGKSTTTGMVAYALTECGEDPSWVVGGTIPQLNGGSASGAGKAFVVEACEYDRSFHNLHPTIAIINNIDADHLDCYKDLDDIIDSFRHFVSLVPPEGLIICNGNDPSVCEAVADARCRVEAVGIDHPTTWSVVPTGFVDGCPCGDIAYHGQFVASLQLSVAGMHNLYNATVAVATCNACGVDPQLAADAISKFSGVDRRMTLLGMYRGASVVDDYGHHPTEIKATLKALRDKYQPRKFYCIFQPHQYSRTRIPTSTAARGCCLTSSPAPSAMPTA
jgi:UDP-N-acetylmuramate--alanine ligase